VKEDVEEGGGGKGVPHDPKLQGKIQPRPEADGKMISPTSLPLVSVIEVKIVEVIEASTVFGLLCRHQ
jgi:hypothetical protein